MSAITQQNGVIVADSGQSPFGRMLVGEAWDSVTSKPRAQFIDAAAISLGVAPSSSLNGSAMGEQIVMGTAGASENAHIVVSNVPASTGTGATHFKNTLVGVVNTQAVSNYAGSVVYQATGVVGQAISAGTVTQATLCGIAAQATVSAATDATAIGLSSTVVNSGTAVSTVNTALSKYCLYLQSAGSAKNTAFLYANKTFAGGAGSANCVHGLLVDGASVDSNAFAVVTGTTPTVVWAIGPAGQQTVAVTAPGAGGGPFAGAAASNITISLTGLTTAAQNLSAAIAVNTTAVTAASRISANVISYAYGTAGLMAAGWPAVSLGAIVAGTSFSFQIANLGTGALSGAIGIAFKIEN